MNLTLEVRGGDGPDGVSCAGGGRGGSPVRRRRRPRRGDWAPGVGAPPETRGGEGQGTSPGAPEVTVVAHGCTWSLMIAHGRHRSAAGGDNCRLNFYFWHLHSVTWGLRM